MDIVVKSHLIVKPIIIHDKQKKASTISTEAPISIPLCRNHLSNKAKVVSSGAAGGYGRVPHFFRGGYLLPWRVSTRFDTTAPTATISAVNMHLGRSLVLPVALVLLLTQPALAYLDPGTGSYILQLLIGGILGGLFAVALFWKRVMAFIRRLLTKGKTDGKSGA